MLDEGSTLQNGRYRIERCIAKEGGQGLIYQAWDQNLEGTVAIKETKTNSDLAHDAIKSERNFLRNLNHTALPKVHDFFIENGTAYLVMTYIEGDNLKTRLEKRVKAFPPSEVLAWGYKLMEVLKYLHTQSSGVIHRDIKPSNILVDSQGQLFLLDFGISKEASTTTLMFGASRHYASPEQLNEEGTDARSDIYSLAATLYHLMTNVIPPDSVKERQVELNKGRPDPLQPANKQNPQVTSEIADALMRAMSLDRDKRPATVKKFRQELLFAQNPEKRQAKHLKAPVFTKEPLNSINLWFYVALAMAVILIAVVIIVLLKQDQSANPQTASREPDIAKENRNSKIENSNNQINSNRNINVGKNENRNTRKAAIPQRPVSPLSSPSALWADIDKSFPSLTQDAIDEYIKIKKPIIRWELVISSVTKTGDECALELHEVDIYFGEKLSVPLVTGKISCSKYKSSLLALDKNKENEIMIRGKILNIENDPDGRPRISVDIIELRFKEPFSG